MPDKQRTYYPHDAIALDLSFYQRYNEYFLFNKALALMYITNEKEQFKEQIANIEELKTVSIDTKYFETLRAEIYFTEMHQFEIFFALLLAIFQKKSHWLYLTEYSSMRTPAEQFLQGSILALSDQRFRNKRDFIQEALYLGSKPVQDDLSNRWEENLDNVCWLIERMVERYLDSPEYNDYKHGMRVLTGPSYLTIRLNDPSGNPLPGPGFTHASEDSLTFLELKEEIQQDGRKKYKPVTTTKFINPEESFFYISKMARMLETMKETRLAALQQSEESVPLNMFFDLDKDQIMQMGNRLRISFSTHMTNE